MSSVCPSCGHGVAAGARFCPSCGTELLDTCSSCGATLSGGARFCQSCGRPVPDADRKWDEERKIATIVFVDLVGSTTLADESDPERTRVLLARYFRTVAEVVEAWGGSIEKYIGDAVVAVFGVPRTREDDAARALQASLEIVGAVTSLGDEIEAPEGFRPRVRVGVNTGEVVAPTTVRPDAPMVTGDAVNVAARLQALAEPGTILVGERTAQQVGDAYRFGPIQQLEVRGKARAVAGRVLLGTDAGTLPERPATGLRSRMIGRDRELAVLVGLLDEAIETRRARLATVNGPAGIGKTRLTQELLSIVSAERPDVQVLRGRCPAIARGASFWALAEIVRAACGIVVGEPNVTAQNRLEERVRTLLPASDSATEDTEATVHALATTAGLEVAGNPLDEASPAAVQRELARAWPRFLSALAAQRPTIVIVEDLHWAGTHLIEMIEWIAARSTGALLVVATARPEFEDARVVDVGGDVVTSISLRPLGQDASRSLIDGLLSSALPADLETGIVETADGNPLFIEQLLARLVEDGSIVREGAAWRPAEEVSITLPDTVQGILRARIDALPSDRKRVLQEAAVVGRVFWEEPVARAVGLEDLTSVLLDLERRGLVTVRSTSGLTGHPEFAIKHALVRDEAYAGLPRARRAVAHAAVADWLAGLAIERPDEMAEMVAGHYRAALAEAAAIGDGLDPTERATLRVRGFEALLVGGSTALKRGDVGLALEIHREALAIGETDLEKARALEAIGDDHDAAYHGDEAVPAWDEAIAVRQGLDGDPDAVARLCRKAANMGAMRWGGFANPMDPARIDRYIDQGMETVHDPIERTTLLTLRAAAGSRWLAMHRPDPLPLADRIRAGEEGLAASKEEQRLATAGMALHTLAGLYLAAGSPERTTAVLEETLAIADGIETARDRHLYLLEAFNTMIWLRGDAERHLERIRGWHRLGRELSGHEQLHGTYGLMAALYLTGRWDEIPDVLDEHVAVFDGEADLSCPFARGGLPLGAIVLARRGEPTRAREVLDRLRRGTSEIGLEAALEAIAENALGRPEAGEARAREVFASGARSWDEEPPLEIVAVAEALAAQADWTALDAILPDLRSRAWLLAIAPPTLDWAEGVSAAARGDRTRARQLLRQAVDALDGLAVYEAARAREALASVDAEHSQDLLAEAAAAYEGLGARPDAERLRRAEVSA